MCGLFGNFGEPLSNNSKQLVFSALKGRGPDDQGLYLEIGSDDKDHCQRGLVLHCRYGQADDAQCFDRDGHDHDLAARDAVSQRSGKQGQHEHRHELDKADKANQEG